MPLLNYTTTIAADKTAGEVARMLAAAGARQVLTDYSQAGTITGLSFAVDGPLGRRTYTLPVDPAAVLLILERDRRVPRSQTNIAQAERVAWRIIKDWVEAQLAIVETQMVRLDQVMLPYMHAGDDGRTVYELYLDGATGELEAGAGG